ncbi:MAG TPA: hypothetical protein VJ776_10595, partial [Thermoanaerobaculia bacterium]|nr:hypothetical protein [Thermoanaerobaculia bacterium]
GMTVFSRALTSLLLALLAAALPACRKAAAPAAAGAAPPPALAEAAPVTAPLPAAQADSAGYAFTPAERTAVDEFLRRHSDLRLARDSDRQESRDEEAEADVRRLYGVYHPYFVRGDLNDDGILDFVLAFVRRDSSRDTPWFSVVVFTGRSERGSLSFAAGAFIERDITLARGDLSIDRDAVLITPDLTDESVRRYRWDPLRRSYVFVRDDAEEDDTPIPSRT